mmetsp:Transcript_23242/g.48257  ORF Transcript_23242/g.48257 Transcript_23242/m.48257 type:complete len:818 (-) Transcript_23242:83-2536(-)
MSTTDTSLVTLHLFPVIPPSLRPTQTLPKPLLSTLNKILADPTSPNSNILFYRLMKGLATPDPPVYTNNSNSINKVNGRGSEIALLCALMSKFPSSLDLSGSENGLKIVKYWIKEATFTEGGGGVNILIFILRCVGGLKVTEQSVTRTGIGRVISSITKLDICKGGAGTNGRIIANLVEEVKDAWVKTSKEAKAKEKNALEKSLQNTGGKGGAMFDGDKTTTEETKKESAAEKAKRRAQERMKKRNNQNSSSPSPQTSPSNTSSQPPPTKRPKISFDPIPSIREYTPNPPTGGEGVDNAKLEDDKMEKMKETERIANVKLNDMLKELFANSTYKSPMPLTSTVTQTSVVNSNAYNTWDQTTPKSERNHWVQYLSKDDIPRQPEPLGDEGVERDQSESQRATSKKMEWGEPSQPPPPSAPPQQSNSYFPSPPQPPPPAPSTFTAAAPAAPNLSLPPTSTSYGHPPPFAPLPPYAPPPHNPNNMPVPPPTSSQPPIPSNIPSFLHSEDHATLMILSQTPELMYVHRGSDGKYNKEALIALVKSLSDSLSASKKLESSNAYQPPPGTAMPSNLHVSGYGPGTTQNEIIELFNHYVQVNNVVWKDNFVFVNTSDPVGAARARSALQGHLMNGSPLKINDAIKRVENVATTDPHERQRLSEMIKSNKQPLPMLPTGGIDYDKIRDDKGNPVSSNLWVGGFNNATPPTERELFQLFGPHCEVTNTVIKTGFCFVNTKDIPGAVIARHALQGESIWGGVLKVNFAKGNGNNNQRIQQQSNNHGGGYGGGGFQQPPPQQQQQFQPPPPQYNFGDLPSFAVRGGRR